MISWDDFFKGRDVRFSHDCTKSVIACSMETMRRANDFFKVSGLAYKGTASGWRPLAINEATSNAAKKSNHILGKAIDLVDTDGAIDAYCDAHPEVLEQCGLWREHPSKTAGWCHFQTVAPASGNRTFYP